MPFQDRRRAGQPRRHLHAVPDTTNRPGRSAA
jgi:hypothetical protein